MTRLLDITFIVAAVIFLLWLIANDHTHGVPSASLPFFLL